MPKGGRRFGADAPVFEVATPPRPPREVTGHERAAWVEIAAQLREAGTYTAAYFSAFRLAVKALAAVYEAPADLKETSRKALVESASKMLGRFGLDPVARGQIKAAAEAVDEDDDELAEFEQESVQ